MNLLVGLLAVLLYQQPARQFGASSTAGAMVTGEIVNDAGRPIAHAKVVLMPEDSASRLAIALTGDDGRFVFLAVPSGRYRIEASKPPLVAMTYGAARPGQLGSWISVTAGKPSAPIRVVLPRGASISGTVHDEFGDPVDVEVRAVLVKAGTAGDTLAAPTIGLARVITDDRG